MSVADLAGICFRVAYQSLHRIDGERRMHDQHVRHAVKTVPPAPPGRFSMMTGCPSAADSRSASGRATISTFPPAGNGMTIVICRVGKYWAALRSIEMPAKPNATRVHNIPNRVHKPHILFG